MVTIISETGKTGSLREAENITLFKNSAYIRDSLKMEGKMGKEIYIKPNIKMES